MKHLLIAILGIALCTHSLSHGASTSDSTKIKEYVTLLHDHPIAFGTLSGHHAQFVNYYYQEIRSAYEDAYGEIPAKQEKAIGAVDHKGTMMESYKPCKK